MGMNDYRFDYKLAAIFRNADDADAAKKRFLDAGFQAEQLMTLAPNHPSPDSQIEPEADATRDELIKDTLVGTGVGGAAGGVAAAGIAAWAPALFVPAPIVGPLVALGYGAMIGGIGGAVTGLRLEKTKLASMIKDALKDGWHVLLVHVEDTTEFRRAESLLNETLAQDRISG
jgi:hypothetical protein